MAYDTTQAEDAAALRARRERVRAIAGRIAQAVEAIPLPRTFYDGERAVRAVTFADKMLVRLPGPNPEGAGITPARQRLRRFADRILAIIETLPPPVTFRDSERASRCVLATDTLLEQLYAPPKAVRRLRSNGFDLGGFDPAYGPDAPEPPEGPENSPENAPENAPEDAAATAAPDSAESPEAGSDRLFDRLDRVALAFSRETGFYPDGSACDPAAIEPHRLACPEELDILDQWVTETAGKPFQPNDGLLPLARIMTARANASVRAQVRHSGQWPDGRAFREDDGPAFVLSKRFATEVLKRPGLHGPGPNVGDSEEAPAHALFPWWLVRNPDTG